MVKFVYITYVLRAISSKIIITICIFYLFHISSLDEKSSYDDGNVSMNMRQTLSALTRNTHKFVQQHSDLTKDVEYLRYKNFVENREKGQHNNNKMGNRS